MKRFFSKNQKVDLYLAANGRCQVCGCKLPSNWHADHITPWAKGGETDVSNGMALCPTCNLRKSNKMNESETFHCPEGLILRKWQQEFVDHFFERVFINAKSDSDKNFLLVATPGAGKTIAQLLVAYNLLMTGTIDWLIICVPTDHLRNQMALDAKSVFGLDLFHGVGYADVIEGFCGEVVTYAQVASRPGIWRQRSATKKVMLSADEVHHLGDDLAWGGAYKTAFENAKIRLSTSGTPFRSDDQLIPWIHYQTDKKGNLRSQSDYHYGYGDGLRDEVCRHVVFPSYDADCKWLFGDTSYSANFSDELSEKDSKRLIAATISDDSDWMKTVFQDAQMRLDEIRRQGHDNAAGLIVCKDKRQAESVAKMVERFTGELPTLVTSDVAESSAIIKRFSREVGPGSSKWIVAIKMVSEGVDIKRLRIAVYATNVLTEMYFRQLVGRVIRVVGVAEETAYVYIYPHQALISHVESIKAERDHFIRAKTEESDADLPQSKEGSGIASDDRLTGDSGQLKFYVPIEGRSFEGDQWYNQDRYSIVEISAIRDMAKELGIPEAKMAEIARRFNRQGKMKPAIEMSASPTNSSELRRVEKTSMEELKEKGVKANRIAGRLAANMSIDVGDVHKYWIKVFNGKNHKKSSHPEMDRKIYWLKSCVSRAQLLNPSEIDFRDIVND